MFPVDSIGKETPTTILSMDLGAEKDGPELPIGGLVCLSNTEDFAQWPFVPE